MSVESVLHNVVADKVNPIGDRVLLEREEQEARTASGIMLPEGSRDVPMVCVVIAMGDGEYRDGHLIPMKIKKGQRVVISKYSGTQLKISGKSYVVVKYSDILAKID